jgi:hypothetical protein
MANKLTPATKIQLGMVLMIIPWIFVFMISDNLEKLIFGDLTPNGGYMTMRTIFRKPESTGDLSDSNSGALGTVVSLSISQASDSAGESIMPSQNFILVCPGDSLTISLGMTLHGHIASFTLTDPATGQPRTITNPTSKGSPVKAGASMDISIPTDAKVGSTLRLPWQAKVYIIREIKNSGGTSLTTDWFELVQPFSESGTLEITLNSPESRKAYLQVNNASQTITLLKFFGMAALFSALLFLLRKYFFLVLTALVSFAGFATWTILIYGDLLGKGGFYYGAIVLTLVVVFGAVLILGKYHKDKIDLLLSTNRSTPDAPKQ